MSAHVLLNLLNELRKLDKMRCFRNEFDKFNNTEARMLDSIYHNMTLKSFWNYIFVVKTLGICHIRDVKNVIS